jgi:hypothetical protein
VDNDQFSSATWTPSVVPAAGLRRLEVHAGARLTVHVTGD